MTDQSTYARTVVLSLLALTVLTTGVMVEAEANYADVVRSQETAAQVTDVTEVESGLEFQLAVTNPLDSEIRIEYVRLEIADSNGSVGVSVPFNGYTSIPPNKDVETVDVFVSERRYERLLPLGEPLTVRGYLEVTAYNGYQFQIPIAESEVEL